MIIIGITGGIASGKSAVARGCADQETAILSADLLGHAVLTTDEFKAAALVQWGTKIFKRANPEKKERNSAISDDFLQAENIDRRSWEIDRAALAAVVFDPKDQQKLNLNRLNELTHPVIRRLASEKIEQYQKEGIKVLFLDAPLLYETGMDRLCQFVVFVETDKAVRVKRAESRGWGPEELNRREAAQWPVDQKKKRADFIVENNGTLENAVRILKNRFLNPLLTKNPPIVKE